MTVSRWPLASTFWNRALANAASTGPAIDFLSDTPSWSRLEVEARLPPHIVEHADGVALHVLAFTSVSIGLARITSSSAVVMESEHSGTRAPVALEILSASSFREATRNTGSRLVAAHTRRHTPTDGALRGKVFVVPDSGESELQPTDVCVVRWSACRRGVRLSLSFRSDLIASDVAECLAAVVRLILERGTKDASVSLSDLVAKQVDLVAPRALPTGNASVIGRFQHVASERKNAVALIEHDRELTFGELDHWSARTAAVLRERGVTRGDVVGIQLDQSIEFLVIMVATLRLGAAYAPLPTDAAVDRVSSMVRVGDVKVVVSRTNIPPARTVSPEEALSSGNDPTSELPLSCDDLGSDLHAVLFTSGTTGAPKPLAIPARAVLNRLIWMWSDHALRDGDVGVLLKPPTLVGALWECFGYLLAGHPTLILDRSTVRDPERLWAQLVQHSVSHLLTTPSVLAYLLDEAEVTGTTDSAIRFTSASAEPLPPELVYRWQRVFPTVPLLNLYGTTECSSNVAFFDTRRLEPGAARVPIGNPIPNWGMLIVDDDMLPVPPGVVGELCVWGTCLPNGYLHDAQLTAERFVPHPLEHGSRMYRTGDLGRVRPDGEVILLGRKDAQINLHGFRIEPTEIELTLEHHPDVDEAAVVKVKSGLGTARLLAFVVLRPSHTIDAIALRSSLARRLPPHLVPSEVRVVDRLPRTASGKVARHRLTELWGASERHSLPKGTQRSEDVYQIVASVAELDYVNPERHLSDLGLQSLGIIRLQRRLRRLDDSLTVAELFAVKTVGDLVERLATSQKADSTRDRARRRAEAVRQHRPASRGRGNAS